MEHMAISRYRHIPPPPQHLPSPHEGNSKPFQKTPCPQESPADEQDMVMLCYDEQSYEEIAAWA